MGAFEDNDGSEIISKKKIGVKLSNEKSLIEALPKKPSPEEFHAQASEANQTINNYNVKAGDLALKFKKVLNDPTLLENKSPMTLDAERELLGGLSQLAIDMNNDPHIEIDGMGSIGLTALLMRAIIIQRDRLNMLEYQNVMLNKKVNAIEITLLDLKKIKE